MSVSHDYSYVSSSDNSYIDGLYTDYRRNPDSVDTSWRQFFKGVEFPLEHLWHHRISLRNLKFIA